MITDDKMAINSGWGAEILMLEIQALGAVDYDLGLLGFSDDDLAAMAPEQLQEEKPEVDDSVPETPANPVSRTGDVWLSGEHPLVYGDSTNTVVIDSLMWQDRTAPGFTSPSCGFRTRINANMAKNKPLD